MDAHEDHRELARLMSALSNPTRLAVLKELVTPRHLHEIRVPALTDKPGERYQAGTVSRQAVRFHLESLLESGLVKMVGGSDPDRQEYVANGRQLFLMSELLRSLASARMSPYAPADATVPAPKAPRRPASGTGRLVVVSGLHEGTEYELGAKPLLIGRGESCDVALTYDPYLSTTQCEVRPGPDVVAMAARNPTYLNFRPLAEGLPTRLRQGDVLRVGRTSLVAWLPAGV